MHQFCIMNDEVQTVIVIWTLSVPVREETPASCWVHPKTTKALSASTQTTHPWVRLYQKPSGRGKIWVCCVLVSVCITCIHCVCSFVHACIFWMWLASYHSAVYMATTKISSFTWIKTLEREERGMNMTKREERWENMFQLSPQVEREKKKESERCEVTLTPMILMETGKQEKFLPAVCQRKRKKQTQKERTINMTNGNITRKVSGFHCSIVLYFS